LLLVAVTLRGRRLVELLLLMLRWMLILLRRHSRRYSQILSNHTP
jgi:hypothetical protein